MQLNCGLRVRLPPPPPEGNPTKSKEVQKPVRNSGFLVVNSFRCYVSSDYIEHQLAHAVRDPNGRAYNRTAHLMERRKMMQTWADYLDGLKAGAVVIPFKTAKW
ncbi:hypothetical protein ER57_01990 [Smithella sp. SCADC]|jgi:hypothetical protein|nr:hypothetical protein ER57_01990 [Smithella sp. SCADC]